MSETTADCFDPAAIIRDGLRNARRLSLAEQATLMLAEAISLHYDGYVSDGDLGAAVRTWRKHNAVSDA